MSELDLNILFNDLQELFSHDEINLEELDELKNQFDSDDVSDYLWALSRDTAPEAALATYFFNPKSSYFKELLENYDLISESSIESGVPDLKAKEKDMEREIRIELKKLYQKKGNKLIKQELKPENHRKQVEKYLEDDAPYVILTNLETYYLYSHKDLYSGKQKLEPYAKWELEEIHEKLDMLELYDALERQKSDLSRDELEERFFNDLNKWVKLLREVKFKEEDEKDESIIYLINKLVFVQTLSDLGLIEYNWMKSSWEHWDRRYGKRSPKKVVKNFIEQEIDDFFYGFYDTELFREDILEDIKDTPENYKELYKKLKQVLGFESFQTDFKRSMNGIIQYQYNEIDEDIFGKAYETFLADLRKEEGIYYTPRYISEYIVENTVKEKFMEKADDILETVREGKVDNVINPVKEFKDLKVLDPACGSGSFLLKALETIWGIYQDIEEELNGISSEASQYNSFDDEKVKENNKISNAVDNARRTLGLNDNKRTLLSEVILRHIYGKDKDKRAIDVAKVNLWLKAMKQAPKEFKHAKISTTEETNHILPDLENNLITGDSLIGLESEEVSKALKEIKIDTDRLQRRFRRLKREAKSRGESKEVIKNVTGKILKYDPDKIEEISALDLLKIMNELHKNYIKNPTHSLSSRAISALRNIIYYPDMRNYFEEYLEENNLSSEIVNETRVSHHALDFWHVFLDEDGNKKDSGFDAIIGNPPYVKRQNLSHENIIEYFEDNYHSSTYNFDLYLLFAEKGHKMLNDQGELGYILPSKFITTETGKGLRNYISKYAKIREFIDFDTYQVFEGATTYTCLLFLDNSSETILYKKVNEDKPKKISSYESRNTKIEESLSGVGWDLKPSIINFRTIQEKIKDKGKIFTGIETGSDEIFILDPENDFYNTAKKYEGEIVHKVLKGDNVDPYYCKSEQLVIVPYDKNGNLIQWSEISEKYPEIAEYLKQHEDELRSRENGKMDNEKWYGYVYPKNLNKFDTERIIWPDIAIEPEFSIDNSYWHVRTVASFKSIENSLDLHELVPILNSKVFLRYMLKNTNKVRGGYLRFRPQYIREFPLKLGNEELKELSKEQHKNQSKLKDINLKIKDYLGNYSNARSLNDFYTPTEGLSETILTDTSADREKLRIGSVEFNEQNNNLILKASVRYKPENESEFDDLDRWGYTETDLIPAMQFSVDEKLETLIKEFVPVAVDEAEGFANFRETATKTNSIIDRLEKLTLPKLEDVESGLEKFIENKEKAEKLEREIQETDNEIDAIVFDLYDLTEDEVETVLDSLDTDEDVKRDIIQKFRGIKD